LAVITPTDCYTARTFHMNLRYRCWLSLFLSYSDSTREDGTDRCPETSLNNYHTTPRNIPKERRS
jgi:hypothetical protein